MGTCGDLAGCSCAPLRRPKRPHAHKERKSTEREGHSSTLRWGIASAGAEALSRWFDSNERLLEHAERKIDRLAVPLLSGFVPL